MPSAGSLHPVDATVLLATRGHTMPDGEREAIVASIFDRANRAAQSIASRRPRPAIDTQVPAQACPAPACDPAPAPSAAPPRDEVGSSTTSVGLATGTDKVADDLKDPATPDPAVLTAVRQIEAQRRREAAAAEAREDNERRVEVENARARSAAAERDRRQRAEDGQW